MDNLKFQNFDQKFKSELNSWHSKEHAFNGNGLTQFIVPEDVLLGDYLDFVQDSMPDVTNLLAFDNNQLVAFLGYTQPENNHLHIEFIGVDPSSRGKGYAQKVLTLFKQEVTVRNPKINITLSVKKTNSVGLTSFSKIAKRSQNQDKENYIQFEL